MEYNFFEIVGGAVERWRRLYHRLLEATCPQDKEGNYVLRIQWPLRVVIMAVMAVAAIYILLWIFHPSLSLAGIRIWPSGFFLILSAAVLMAGGFLLWVRYTLTDTDLIIQSLTSHRIPLEYLEEWAEDRPPEIIPGRRILLSLAGEETVTMALFPWAAGSVHFVMLLGEMGKVPLIDGYLGVEDVSPPVKTS